MSATLVSPRRWHVLLALLVAAVSVLPGMPARAATAPFPYTLSVQGGYGSAEVVVPVPEGTAPIRLRGTIDSSYSTPGDLVITVNGRRAASVPAVGGGPLTVDLAASDVVDGGITIGLRAALQPHQDCWQDDQAVATLTDPVLRLDADPPAPTTIAEFLAAGSPAYVIAVPSQPTPAEQQAGLDAVLALRHLFPDQTSVTLVTTDDPQPTSPRSRTLVVTENGTGGNSLAVQDGRLLVSGDAAGLPAAAISLADPNTGLLDLASVTDLPGTAAYDPVTDTASFARLGISDLAVSGIGRVAQTVPLAQAWFGAPVKQLIVDLQATATPVLAGQQGRVNVLWNDELIASQTLTTDSRVGLRFTVSALQLRNVNDLTLELQYQPAGGDCRTVPLPGKVEVDVDNSTITPTFGASVGPGFQRFPQSFGAEIPVAVVGSVTQALPNIASLLAAATASSPQQYVVTLADVADLPDGGVAAGVTAEQADAFGAPLPSDTHEFAAGQSGDYAALQAFQSGQRDLIVLSDQPAEPAQILATWPTAAGWSTLTGQVYVTSGGLPEAFETPSTAPDKQTPQLIAAGVTSAVLLMALALWLWRRPKRG